MKNSKSERMKKRWQYWRRTGRAAQIQARMSRAQKKRHKRLREQKPTYELSQDFRFVIVGT